MLTNDQKQPAELWTPLQPHLASRLPSPEGLQGRNLNPVTPRAGNLTQQSHADIYPVPLEHQASNLSLAYPGDKYQAPRKDMLLGKRAGVTQCNKQKSQQGRQPAPHPSKAGNPAPPC